MQQPTLENVIELFKKDGWSVEVEYDGSKVKLCAQKKIMEGELIAAAYSLWADFAYRDKDLVHAPVLLDNQKKENLYSKQTILFHYGYG